MSNKRPPSRPPERRPSSGQYHDSYFDDDFRRSVRNGQGSRPSGQGSRPSSSSPSSRPYPSDWDRDKSGRPSSSHSESRYDTHNGQRSRPPSSRPPSNQRSSGGGRQPPSNQRPPSRPPANRRKKKASPMRLILPVILLLAIIAVFVVVLRSCVFNDKGKNGDYALEFTQTIVMGGSTTATVTGLPEEYDTSKISWGSSDPSIVKVAKGTGEITALKVGDAIVSAEVNGVHLSKTVKVVATVEGVKEITLSETSKTLYSEETFQLEYTLTFISDTPPDIAVAATWDSDNPTVALVTNAGLVTGRNVGKANITAKVGDQTATCEITVEIEPNTPAAGSDDEADTGDTDTPADTTGGDTSTDNKSTTNTTDKKTTTGTTDKKTTTNTGTTGTGNKTTVVGLEISQELGNISVGDTLPLSAATSPAGSKITWTSSDSSVATVSSNGLVTAKKAGTVTITAKSGSTKKTCTIEIDAEEAGSSTTEPETPLE